MPGETGRIAAGCGRLILRGSHLKSELGVRGLASGDFRPLKTGSSAGRLSAGQPSTTTSSLPAVNDRG